MRRILMAFALVGLTYPAFAQDDDCILHLEKAHDFAKKALARIAEIEKTEQLTCQGIDEAIVLQSEGLHHFARAQELCSAAEPVKRECDASCIADALARTKRLRYLTCPS